MLSMFNYLHKLYHNNQNGIKLDLELVFYYTKKMLTQSIGQDFQKQQERTNILLVIGQDGSINKIKLNKEAKDFKVMILLLIRTSMIQMMRMMKKVI
jgi:hypothetical protein